MRRGSSPIARKSPGDHLGRLGDAQAVRADARLAQVGEEAVEVLLPVGIDVGEDVGKVGGSGH